MKDMPTDAQWRCAFQIAPQLPADRDEAWTILGLLGVLMSVAYGDPQPPAPTDGGNQLLLFPSGGAKTPRRRASSSGSPSAFPK